MPQIVMVNGKAVQMSDAEASALLGPSTLSAVTFPALMPRRFWLAALSLNITEAMVDAKIAALPEPQREAAMIEKRHAKSYDRYHPLVQSLPQAFGISEVALDAAWLNAPA